MNKKIILLAVVAAVMMVLSACGTNADTAASLPSDDLEPSASESVTQPENTDEPSSKGIPSEKYVLAEGDIEDFGREYVEPEVLKGNYYITIDGITLTLPIKVSDLLELGFVPDGNHEPIVLPDGLTDDFWGTLNGIPLAAHMLNFGDKDVDYKDAYVTWVNFDDHYFPEEERRDIVLPGGLKLWESTIDDIVALYGEPERATESSVYEWEIDYTVENNDDTEPETDHDLVLYVNKEEPHTLVGFTLSVVRPINP